MLHALLVSRLAQLAGGIPADLDVRSGTGRTVWELVALVLLAGLLFLVLSLLIGVWSGRKLPVAPRHSFDLAARQIWSRPHTHRGRRHQRRGSEPHGR
jgi:hypothetical protein